MKHVEDGPWYWNRKITGVEFKRELNRAENYMFTVTVRSTTDHSLSKTYNVPSAEISDVSHYLLQAQMDFLKLRQQRADEQRARRISQQDERFKREYREDQQGDVQERKIREPLGAPEVNDGQEGNQGPRGGGSRVDSDSASQEDSPAGDERVPEVPKDAPRSSPRARKGGRRSAAKSGNIASDRNRAAEGA